MPKNDRFSVRIAKVRLIRQAVEMALICLRMPAENSWIRSLAFESKILSEAPEDVRWKSMWAVVCAFVKGWMWYCTGI